MCHLMNAFRCDIGRMRNPQIFDGIFFTLCNLHIVVFFTWCVIYAIVQGLMFFLFFITRVVVVTLSERHC